MLGAIRIALSGGRVKTVYYDPNLCKKLIIYGNGWHGWHSHPAEKDESDSIEEEKTFKTFKTFKKVPNKWGGTTITME